MSDWYSSDVADLHIHRLNDIDGRKIWSIDFIIITNDGPNIIKVSFSEKFRHKVDDYYTRESFTTYIGSVCRRRILIDEAINWRRLWTARKDINIAQLKLKIVSVCNCIIHDRIPSIRLMRDLVWILNNPASDYSEPDYREYQKHIERNCYTDKYELNLDYATRRKIWASAFGCR